MIDRGNFRASVEAGQLIINFEQRAYITQNESGKTYSVHYTRSGICAGNRYHSAQAALDFVARVFFTRWLRGQDTENL